MPMPDSSNPVSTPFRTLLRRDWILAGNSGALKVLCAGWASSLAAMSIAKSRTFAAKFLLHSSQVGHTAQIAWVAGTARECFRNRSRGLLDLLDACRKAVIRW